MTVCTKKQDQEDKQLKECEEWVRLFLKDFGPDEVFFDAEFDFSNGSLKWDEHGTVLNYKWLTRRAISIYNDTWPFHAHQGYIGDCWLIAALMTIARRQKLLEWIIPPNDYSLKHGIFLVRLFFNGEWQIVVVDGHFPCNEQAFPEFAFTFYDRLWPCLKAYCDIRMQADMTRVPRNNEALQMWFRTLGNDFENRVLGATSRVFICREHVPNAAPRRSRFGIPYETRGLHEENVSVDENPVYLKLEDDMLFDDDFVVVNEEVLEDKDDFEYIPTQNEEKEQEDVDLAEKDVKLIDYIIVDHTILLNAILYCRNCHSADVGFDQERISGANISMNLTCNSCQSTWKWCSSQRMIDGKSFMVNRDISTACSVTGMSYHKFSTCCETLRIPILTESEHCKIVKNHVAPLVTNEHNKLQEEVLEIVVDEAEKRGSLDLSGDAQYDSPGFSALNCRYALIDVATDFVVDVEHVKKSSQNGKFVKTLANSTLNVTVSSITTDRDPAVGKLLAKKYPNIKQMYDGWHFARNLQKILWKKQDQVQMKPAKRWIEPLRNHLYWSIGTSGGNGKLAVEKFLSFFYHTQNIHDNFKEIGGYQFSTVFHCDHGNINGSGYFDLANPHHKKAWELLLDMATEKKRLKDLEHVSPFFSTSQVESFNNVALTYHPKNTFFRAKSFSLRVKLSVIHWNNLKLEEKRGIRQVAGKKSHYNKSLKKVTHRKFLSPGSFDWRRRILEFAREHRAETNEEEEEDDDDEQEEICIDFLNSYNADLRVWEKRDDCDFSDEFDDSYDEGTDNAT